MNQHSKMSRFEWLVLYVAGLVTVGLLVCIANSLVLA